MKIKYLFVVLFLTGCGMQDLIRGEPSLSAKLPRVTEVNPKHNGLAGTDSLVLVSFSEGIDPASIGKNSFIIAESFNDPPPKVLEDDLEEGNVRGVDGEYSIAEDNLSVTFHPKNPFLQGASYGVIVTRDVFTKDRINLPMIFVSKFEIVATDKETDVAAPIKEGESTTSSGEKIEEKEPLNLIISEIFYDATGADTGGELFFELRGVVGDDISGCKMVFINGDDGKVTQSVVMPDGATVNAGGLYVAGGAKVEGADYVVSFDPHNGPDAVQLMDSDGNLLDAVCYGNAATTVSENGLEMCEGGAAPDSLAGQSISRLADGEDTNDNSIDFIINLIPTPGKL